MAAQLMLTVYDDFYRQVMYFNLRLEHNMFEPALLGEISRQAAGSVQVDQEDRALAGVPRDR